MRGTVNHLAELNPDEAIQDHPGQARENMARYGERARHTKNERFESILEDASQKSWTSVTTPTSLRTLANLMSLTSLTSQRM